MSTFDDLFGAPELIEEREESIEPPCISDEPVEESIEPVKTTRSARAPKSVPEIDESEPATIEKPKRATRTKASPKPAIVVEEGDTGDVLPNGWDRLTAIRKIRDAAVLPRMKAKLDGAMKFPTALQLQKKTDEELSKIITEIDFHLNATGGLSETIEKAVLPVILNGYERALCSLGVDVEGVATLLGESPEFLEMIEVLVWKRIRYTQWPPEIRMAICIATTTTKAYIRNKTSKAFSQHIDIQAHSTAYGDL